MQEWMNIIVTLLAFAALWWRLTARTAGKSDMAELGSDVDGTEENLQAEINKLDESMESGFNRIDAKLDAGLAHLDTRISANSQVHHADIMEVVRRIDGVANDFRPKSANEFPVRPTNPGLNRSGFLYTHHRQRARRFTKQSCRVPYSRGRLYSRRLG